MANDPSIPLYRTIWRWHFYAGLFVVPMILILSLTGAIYLFKPQVERWEERAFHNLPVTGAVAADTQVKAALAAFPGSQLRSYRLAERAGNAHVPGIAALAPVEVGAFGELRTPHAEFAAQLPVALIVDAGADA